MPGKTETFRDRIADAIDGFLDHDMLMPILSSYVSDELASFDSVAMTSCVYRIVKNKRGKERKQRSGTIAAALYKRGENVTCHIGFSLCNPTDEWDDEVAKAIGMSRAKKWQDYITAYIGASGEKDIPGITYVFIPHHISGKLYDFVVRIKALFGHYCVFPKWVYNFMHKYEAIQRNQENARIAKKEEQKQIKHIQKALKALEGIDKE